MCLGESTIILENLAGIVGKQSHAKIDDGTKSIDRHLRDYHLLDGEVLASLDVAALFKIVPLKETVNNTFEVVVA